MEVQVINGISCLKRDVDNIDVYKILLNNRIKGVPLVVKIEDFTVYYQFISGDNLREYVNKKKNLGKLELSNIIISLINILDDLKKINIIHKDLKPENIIVSTEINVYVTDFDVSRVGNEKNTDTTLFGTKGYASPEHFGYNSTTFKSDMYSLGKIIEELDTENQYVSIVNKCTQIDPANRYKDYQGLLSDVMKIREINRRLAIMSLYIFLFIVFMVAAFETPTIPDFVISVAASFILVDIIDYIRVIVTRKKVLKKKLFVSVIVISVLCILYILFDK